MQGPNAPAPDPSGGRRSVGAMPTYDLHVHTYLSACCSARDEQQPAAILARAHAMGLAAIGFSDHIWANPAIEPCDWYRPQNGPHVQRLRDDLAAVADSPVRALVGCEADTIAPGRFGLIPEFAAPFDHVLLSCSHFHMKGFVEQPADDTPAAVGRHLLKFFRSAVQSGLPTAIAHPFLPFGFTTQFEAAIASISDEEFADAFGLAARAGVALEITTSFLPPDPPSAPGGWRLETPARFLRLAREAGCRFTFGSDAHNAAQQQRLPHLAPLIAEAGITLTDILPPP